MRGGVSIEERFWMKVAPLDAPPPDRPELGPCREWTGTRIRKGYGHFRVGESLVLAHRYAYEQANGPIPEGMLVDHLCRVRACVNPKHLELVTPQENTLRGVAANPDGFGSYNRAKTRCPAGHVYDTTNTYTDSKGIRHCRTCRRERMAAARRAK